MGVQRNRVQLTELSSHWELGQNCIPTGTVARGRRRSEFIVPVNPFGKLKTALNAEVDKEACASLYRTESRPFAKPKSGASP